MAKEISPVEVMDHCIDRYRGAQRQSINALADVGFRRGARARRYEAETHRSWRGDAEGAFFGIPTAAKDFLHR